MLVAAPAGPSSCCRRGHALCQAAVMRRAVKLPVSAHRVDVVVPQARFEERYTMGIAGFFLGLFCCRRHPLIAFLLRLL